MMLEGWRLAWPYWEFPKGNLNMVKESKKGLQETNVTGELHCL